MKIMVRLDDELTARRICRLLDAQGHHVAMPGRKSRDDRFIPDILLLDITNLRTELLTRYPNINVFLVDDADVKPENVSDALLSYRAAGILPAHPGLQRVWIDQGAVKLAATGLGVKTNASAATNPDKPDAVHDSDRNF